MNPIVVTYQVKSWNLRRRIEELPYAAYKRVREEVKSKMNHQTMKSILFEYIESTSPKNVEIFATALRCEVWQVCEPNHQFRDPRTPEEKAEDLLHPTI